MNPLEQSTWHLLLIDDDEDDYFLTKSLLAQAKGRKIQLDWASSYESGEESLRSTQYDAVLVDYDLGGRTGIELIREAVGAGYPAPMILYTGRGSHEVDLEAMQAGAALYLTKGEAGPLMLERSIRYAIERELAEASLRDSRESYRRLFNTMLDGFALHEMIYDPNGKPVDYRFLEINPAFEELTGLKAADILGKNLLEILPETETHWIETYGEVARTGNSVRFENYHRSLKKYFEVVAFSPRPNQFAVIFTDITGRRLAEQTLQSAHEELERRVQERTSELKKANEILETMFSSVNLMVALMDREFNFIRVNENYARADGRDTTFFVGKNHFDLFPHEENEAIFRQVVETGVTYTFHARPFEYPDHPERGITYWDWSLQAIKDESGWVSAVVLSLVNVTEHKRAEIRLNQYAAETDAMAEMLEKMFQAAPDAILLIDGDGKISRVNRQTESMFGYSEQELIGQPIEILLPARVRLAHVTHRLSYSDSPVVQPMGQGSGYSGQRKDGQELTVDIMISPIIIKGSSIMICVVREIRRKS